MTESGYLLVELLTDRGQPFGKITLPPFEIPPTALVWRGIFFLRRPRAGLLTFRYQMITGYQVPDEQEAIHE